MKLLKLPVSENMIQNRIDNFHREMLEYNISPEDIDSMLYAIEHYVMEMGEGDYFTNAAFRIAEARFWIGQVDN